MFLVINLLGGAWVGAAGETFWSGFGRADLKRAVTSKRKLASLVFTVASASSGIDRVLHARHFDFWER